MFALGHVGIGRRLVPRYRAFTSRERWIFTLGALLPDLIDKPLYYIPSWITGKRGAELGLIAGTHSFGHTGLFLLALTAAALLFRRPVLRALALGVATHLALDVVARTMDNTSLFWPLLGWRFTPFLHRGLGEHLWTVLNPVILTGELVGGAIILWDLWRARRPPRRA
jgi:LexA-binding, inner membrane-associated putative hydrolase